MKRAVGQPGDERRTVLKGIALVPAGRLVPGVGSAGGGALAAAVPALAPSAVLAATPACGPDTTATPRQTEGPYFTPSSPRRDSLVESGMRGDRLLLSGRVLGTDCRPIARALVDLWQADAEGAYDNRGFRLRGHVYADDDGHWRIETIMPGLYPGRTRHLHVKVQPPGGAVLTTQLYFPGDDARNRRDWIYDAALLLDVTRPAPTMQASFDFVIASTGGAPAARSR